MLPAHGPQNPTMLVVLLKDLQNHAACVQPSLFSKRLATPGRSRGSGFRVWGVG